MKRNYLQPELEVKMFNSTDIMAISNEEVNDNVQKNPWEEEE